MAGLHNQIATALATSAAAVSGIQSASATPLDGAPVPPFVIIGPPRGQLQPASWERLFLVFPMHVFVARLSSVDRDQVAINDFLDLFLTQFKTGITLGLAGVSEAVIASWDTNKEQEIGGETYQLIEFLVTVEVDRAATYTA